MFNNIPVDYMKILEKYHLLMGWTAALNRNDQTSDVFSNSSVANNGTTLSSILYSFILLIGSILGYFMYGIVPGLIAI